MKKKVGIIGYGTIGKYLFENLSKNDVEVVFIFKKAEMISEPIADLFITSIDELQERCARGIDLVIEAATSQAVKDLAPTILPHTNMAVFSSTVFADQQFYEEVIQLCNMSRHHLYIPHGAVLGVDGIFDGKSVLQEVSITTVKKPKALNRNDTERTIVYEGPTRNACELFPRNVNVHATIALAGLGFDKTQSKVISDPDAPGNTHLIQIKAAGCSFNIEVVSEPISGVTGAYVPVSAYSSIRKIFVHDAFIIV